eukprot:3221994-Alexandrium_andersonii.AAC.1
MGQTIAPALPTSLALPYGTAAIEPNVRARFLQVDRLRGSARCWCRARRAPRACQGRFRGWQGGDSWSAGHLALGPEAPRAPRAGLRASRGAAPLEA